MKANDPNNGGDARLTARVLEELGGEESRRLEEELQANPEGERLRREMAETEELADVLRRGFTEESRLLTLNRPILPPALPWWHRPGVWAAAAAVVLTVAGGVLWDQGSRRSAARPSLAAPDDRASAREEFVFRVTVDPSLFAEADASSSQRGVRPGEDRGPRSWMSPPGVEARGVSPDSAVELELGRRDSGSWAARGAIGFVSTADQRFSSFPLFVAEDSWRVVSRSLERGHWPAPRAIRVEELVNRFALAASGPERAGDVLSVGLECSVCPWQPGHRLVVVSLRALGTSPGAIVARDVEVLVDFNPHRVDRFRLLGYPEAEVEPGRSAARDLLAAGTVTAVYQVVFRDGEAEGGRGEREAAGPRGQSSGSRSSVEWKGRPEYLSVRVGYTDANRAGGRRILSRNLLDPGTGIFQASDEFRAVAAAAALALRLRGENDGSQVSFRDMNRWVTGMEHPRHVTELRELLSAAESLAP